MESKEVTKKVLQLLGEEGLSGLRIASTSATDAFVKATRGIIDDRYVQKKIFDQLKRQNMIDVSEIDGVFTLCITPKAAHKLLAMPLEDLKITPMNPWDGHWRMVTFDIPKGKNSERLYFYRKLRSLGFTLLSRSIWVHPYECRKEIFLLTNYLGISRHVEVHTISQLDQRSASKLKHPEL